MTIVSSYRAHCLKCLELIRDVSEWPVVCDLSFGNLMITSGGGGGGGGGIIHLLFIPLILVTPYINLLRDENTDGLPQIIY